jgi:hypothetical protein
MRTLKRNPGTAGLARYGPSGRAGRPAAAGSAHGSRPVTPSSAEKKSVPPARARSPEGREGAIIAWLLAHDEYYRNIEQLPEDIRARERYFLGNSLRGMIEYVEGLTVPERKKLAES